MIKLKKKNQLNKAVFVHIFTTYNITNKHALNIDFSFRPQSNLKSRFLSFPLYTRKVSLWRVKELAIPMTLEMKLNLSESRMYKMSNSDKDLKVKETTYAWLLQFLANSK